MRGVFITKSGRIEKPLRGELLKGRKWRTDPSEDVRKTGEAVKGALKAPSAKWKIDDESPWIEVVDRSNVVVLMRSKQLVNDANGNDTVAFTFRAGRGRILHVLSHFGRQQNIKDEFDLQNMLLNFLMEAYRTHMRLKRKK